MWENLLRQRLSNAHTTGNTQNTQKCEEPGHKSLYIGYDLVVEAVSSCYSAHIDLSSKLQWQAHIPTALPYFRAKLPRQEYVNAWSGVLQLPKNSGLTAHALEKCTGFSHKSNCKVHQLDMM